MNLEQAATQYQPVSLKALKRMFDDGLISAPLNEGDRLAMALLSRLWSNEWYVAQMNISFKPAKRAMMLAFPNFGKIERYILSSFLPGENDNKFRVSVKDVSNNLRNYFHIEYPEFKIKRIRQIAYNMRRSNRGERKKLYLSLSALEKETAKKCRKNLSNNPVNKLF